MLQNLICRQRVDKLIREQGDRAIKSYHRNKYSKIKTILIYIFLFIQLDSYAQDRYDVVIDEIMADPTPAVGLPNSEWIEIKNTSTSIINLQGWRVGDASGQSGLMPPFQLLPDSFVIICSAGSLPAMSGFGMAIPVTSFPSLDNDGDKLFLKAANGKTIHAVNYQSSWYRNELKKEGGWSLEMINPLNPCTGQKNWNASDHTHGGSPGRKNSIDANNDDQVGPNLLHAYTTDSLTIILVFDEPVDSLKGAMIANYTIDGGLNINGAVTLSPLFDQVRLKLQTSMQPGVTYNITVSTVTDCSNNAIANINKAKLGLPETAWPGDLVINEILFDPKPNGFDYVEVYNNSDRILDAANLYVANRNSSGAISSMRSFSQDPFFIFPGEYLVITENAARLALHYHVRYPDRVFEITSMPSFPDDEGIVIVLNFRGDVLDEVAYHSNWHFKLLQDKEGISLEKIDALMSSTDPENWHSAASTAGYGTPGYINSQFKKYTSSLATIELIPAVFSPDNDGKDDVASIVYKTGSPGYIANLVIFDAAGRPVRKLIRNAILGTEGHWNWDGLDEKGNQLPLGVYVIFVELFNLEGKVERFKNVVTLARKL